MTAEPCAHDRWKGAADVVSQAICSRCSWSANDIIAALRARAKQAEQERDEAVAELGFHRIPSAKGMCPICYDAGFTAAVPRYDRLRDAAREVVRLFGSEEINGDTGDGCHALRKLAEEATQKPAGEGGPSEGGR